MNARDNKNTVFVVEAQAEVTQRSGPTRLDGATNPLPQRSADRDGRRWGPGSLPRRRATSLLTDLGSSLLTQALIVLGNVVTLRIAAQVMTPDAVGELALGRRVLVFLSPPLLLGLNIGLPRILAAQVREVRLLHATTVAGWGAGVIAALVAAVLILGRPDALATILFGNAQHVRLIQPLIVMIVGQQIFMLTFAVFRGRLQVRQGNVLQLLHAGVVPVVAVLSVGRGGASAALWGIGVGTCCMAALGTIVLLRSIRWEFCRRDVVESFRTLMRFGLPRVPGDLANAGLYALGPLLAAHELDLHAAGMLAIGLQLVTLVAAAFSPLGMVLLPRLSRALVQEGEEHVRALLPAAIGVVIYASALMSALGAGFGNTVLAWVLSAEYRLDPLGLGLLALAAGANVIVVVLRSWNDAANFRPVNAINAMIALSVQVASWCILGRILIDRPFVAICGATAAGFVLQAILTLRAICRRFQLKSGPSAWMRWVTVQLLLAITIVILSSQLPSRGTIAAIVAQLLAVTAWLLSLLLVRERCFLDLFQRVRAGRSVASSADCDRDAAGIMEEREGAA